ncbi:uncharacterized protein ACA1_058830 [Acanthamoeba castellanii str. Neff]|uniref:Uncharacterized protein n=1 Tax=Acanthamoeba castellanii (strain ATCC 30010 / Neff) TaxID=1257118 RepID=L8GWB6_ACACF|nr:uncharacterized protein ACA1_058830 [Acanthamoeba castellanii str. Neff]ELR17217.1 hypothetical protein ACA1_058830 [Acanthamoeba castellanii str. Neff]
MNPPETEAVVPADTYSDALARSLAAFVEANEKALTDDLKTLLRNVSITGLSCYSWEHLRVLLGFVIKQVIGEFITKEGLTGQDAASINERCAQIRLCELLTDEPRLYTSTNKFTNAIEKMFAVSGIIPTLAPADYNETVATNAAAFAAATREAPPAAPAAPAASSPSSASSSDSTPFQVETTVHPPEPMDVEG